MPMEALRLNREDHPPFQDDFAALAQHRLLLVKPWSHTVPNQRCGVIDPLLFELLYRKRVDLTGSHAGAAPADGLAVDLKGQFVAAQLFRARRPQNGEAGLMSRATVEVRDGAVAHNIDLSVR